MTDNEIIKALECCGKESDCEKCPYFKNKHHLCGESFNKDVLDLINRKNAEIERLEQNLKEAFAEIEALKQINLTYEAEAVKEFAERLKEELEGEYIKATNKLENAQNIVVSTNIKIVDNLVKEMVGES